MARRKKYAEEVTLADHLRGIASKGGKAQAESMTPEERSEWARKGGQAGGAARAAALTAAKRKAIASAAAKARWAKVKKK